MTTDEALKRDAVELAIQFHSGSSPRDLFEVLATADAIYRWLKDGGD